MCFFGEDDELNITHNTQPCLLTAEIATFEVLKSKGILPNSVAGFSLGEYAALVAAGVISFEDALKVVQIRADSMQRAVPIGEGAMAAVQTSDRDIIKKLCDISEGYIIGANYNCPGQIVVSGTKKAIIMFCKLSKKMGITATRIPVSAPFHCKMMEPAKKELAKALENVKISDAQIPVFMNVNAKPELDAKKIKSKLIEQVASPVFWEDTLHNMANNGITSYVEIGPGDTLSRFVSLTFPNNPKIITTNIDNYENLIKYCKMQANDLQV